MKLNDPTLLRVGSYINGGWVAGKTRFAVTNPANGEVIAENSITGSTTDGVVVPASPLATTLATSRVRLEFTVVSAQLFSFVLVGQLSPTALSSGAASWSKSWRR